MSRLDSIGQLGRSLPTVACSRSTSPHPLIQSNLDLAHLLYRITHPVLCYLSDLRAAAESAILEHTWAQTAAIDAEHAPSTLLPPSRPPAARTPPATLPAGSRPVVLGPGARSPLRNPPPPAYGLLCAPCGETLVVVAFIRGAAVRKATPVTCAQHSARSPGQVLAHSMRSLAGIAAAPSPRAHCDTRRHTKAGVAARGVAGQRPRLPDGRISDRP